MPLYSGLSIAAWRQAVPSAFDEANSVRMRVASFWAVVSMQPERSASGNISQREENRRDNSSSPKRQPYTGDHVLGRCNSRQTEVAPPTDEPQVPSGLP